MARRGGLRTPFWQAERLIGFAGLHWIELDGIAVDRGIDLVALPVSRLCNWIEHVLLANRKEAEAQKVRTWLDKPPKNEPRKKVDRASGPWSAGAEMNAFKAAQMTQAAAGG